MELKDSIKMLLYERNMKAVDLAKKSGINYSHLNSIICGRTKSPRISSLNIIANGLGVTIGELFHYKLPIDAQPNIRIQFLMLKNGLSRIKLAKKLGVSRQAISELMYRTRHNITLRAAKKLAKAIGVSIDEVAGEKSSNRLNNRKPNEGDKISDCRSKVLKFENLVKVNEVARLLKRTPQSVYQLAIRGKLPHYKLEKSYLFDVEEIKQLIGDNYYPSLKRSGK